MHQRYRQRTTLLDDMIARQTAQNIPFLRDRPSLPIHRNSGLLPSLFPGLLRDSASNNRSKISPKSVHFRICDFLTASPSINYNFNTVKWSDFPTFHRDLNLTHNHNLNLGPWLSFAPLRLCDFALSPGLNPKPTKTDRFRPKSPGTYYTNKSTCSPSMSVAQVSNLPYRRLQVCNQKLSPITHDLNAMAGRCPFSLGEKVRMRDRLVPPILVFVCTVAPARQSQNEKK